MDKNVKLGYIPQVSDNIKTLEPFLKPLRFINNKYYFVNVPSYGIGDSSDLCRSRVNNLERLFKEITTPDGQYDYNANEEMFYFIRFGNLPFYYNRSGYEYEELPFDSFQTQSGNIHVTIGANGNIKVFQKNPDNTFSLVTANHANELVAHF